MTGPCLALSARRMCFLMGVVLVLPAVVIAQDQGTAEPEVNWVTGPGAGALGNVAEIAVPEGHVFAGAEDTIKLMTMMENPTNGSELGFIAKEEEDWFVVFEFENIGYVKDDEKDELDADAMLESIKAGNDQANAQRRRMGWGTMEIVGWEQPPRYDPVTNNLVWAIRGRSEDGDTVNYNTRRLGRSGVMSITLVVDPTQLDSTIAQFEAVMTGFAFVPGQKYSEFQPGDKIAEYGLTALVTGGAVAVAAKTGLLKHLWKIIIVAVAGVGAFIKKLFGGGGGETTA